MLADSLTKLRDRSHFLEVLRRGEWAVEYDSSLVDPGAKVTRKMGRGDPQQVLHAQKTKPVSSPGEAHAAKPAAVDVSA